MYTHMYVYVLCGGGCDMGAGSGGDDHHMSAYRCWLGDHDEGASMMITQAAHVPYADADGCSTSMACYCSTH